MKTSRVREAADLNVTDRVYKALMEDARDEIRSKAIEDARAEVRREVAAAETRASTAAAETARVEAKLGKAEAQIAKGEALLAKAAADMEGAQGKIERLNNRAVALEKTIKLEQGTLTAKDLEYKKEIAKLEGELRALKGDKHGLEMEVSNLNGRLTVAQAKPKPAKIAAKKVPEFIIESVVYGGPENRPISAKIKPVRAN
jgi:chromosome segregation ATPase